MPRSCKRTGLRSWRSKRSTIDSPADPGNTETRISKLSPLTRALIRPSCGMRRSAISRLERILTRQATASNRSRGCSDCTSISPSTRTRTQEFAFRGFDVDVRCALRDRLRQDRIDQLDRRALFGQLAQRLQVVGCRPGSPAPICGRWRRSASYIDGGTTPHLKALPSRRDLAPDQRRRPRRPVPRAPPTHRVGPA